MPGGMEVFDYGEHFNAPKEKRNSGWGKGTAEERQGMAEDNVIATGNHITIPKRKVTLHKGMKKYKHNTGKNRDT